MTEETERIRADLSKKVASGELTQDEADIRLYAWMKWKDKLNFPFVEHHERVRAMLNKAVREGAITQADADVRFANWIETRREVVNRRSKK